MTDYFNIDYDDMFGSDSGEHEKESALREYFVDLPEFKKFFNPSNELGIVRARKGMGKSALLKVLALRQREHNSKDIIITATGNELMGMGDFSNKGQAYLENHWKQVICKRICIEIGRKINFALTDNSMSMVEVAEIEGYKSLNILSALTERTGALIQKALAIASGSDILDTTVKRGAINPEEALKHFQGDGDRNVWILVDDIDAKYVDNDEHQERVGAFFSAIRSLAFNVSGLRLRASVRTDVWRNLRKMEDQDKLRQYVIDIAWRDNHLKSIFAKRILAYLNRLNFKPAAEWDEHRNYNDLLDQVFWGNFYWTGMTVEPFIPLKFLAGGRPRWMGQLAKLAGVKAGQSRISFDNVIEAMQVFGQEKVADIQKEHLHQFELLDKLIQSFRSGRKEYSRYQLLKHIEDKFSSKLVEMPNVNGFPYKNSEQLAEFLFEIDFLVAHHNGRTDYTTYDNDPDLFTTEENNQNKIQWTIHSSYRNFLRIVQ